MTNSTEIIKLWDQKDDSALDAAILELKDSSVKEIASTLNDIIENARSGLKEDAQTNHYPLITRIIDQIFKLDDQKIANAAYEILKNIKTQWTDIKPTERLKVVEDEYKTLVTDLLKVLPAIPLGFVNPLNDILQFGNGQNNGIAIDALKEGNKYWNDKNPNFSVQIINSVSELLTSSIPSIEKGKKECLLENLLKEGGNINELVTLSSGHKVHPVQYVIINSYNFSSNFLDIMLKKEPEIIEKYGGQLAAQILYDGNLDDTKKSMLEALYKNGANVNSNFQLEGKEYSALQYICEHHDKFDDKTWDIILSQNIDLTKYNPIGMILIQQKTTSRFNGELKLEKLLEKSDNVSAEFTYKEKTYNPVSFVIENYTRFRNTSILEKLLEKCDFKKDDFNPFESAFGLRFTEHPLFSSLLQKLKDAGADLDAKFGNPPKNPVEYVKDSSAEFHEDVYKILGIIVEE